MYLMTVRWLLGGELFLVVVALGACGGENFDAIRNLRSAVKRLSASATV
jgi:hypothetical protein